MFTGATIWPMQLSRALCNYSRVYATILMVYNVFVQIAREFALLHIVTTVTRAQATQSCAFVLGADRGPKKAPLKRAEMSGAPARALATRAVSCGQKKARRSGL